MNLFIRVLDSPLIVKLMCADLKEGRTVIYRSHPHTFTNENVGRQSVQRFFRIARRGRLKSPIADMVILWRRYTIQSAVHVCLSVCILRRGQPCSYIVVRLLLVGFYCLRFAISVGRWKRRRTITTTMWSDAYRSSLYYRNTTPSCCNKG